MKKTVFSLMPLLLWTVGAGFAQNPTLAPDGGYLFAHMTKEDYGRLYYAISRDALRWTPLNGEKRIQDDYRGHPDICQGHDGRFYMTGGSQTVTLWASENLVSWSKHLEFNPDVYKTPGFKPAEKTHGAPKIFYDADAALYLISWHTSQNKKLKEEPEHYWSGQRTLFITSKDLKTFSEPRRLFPFEMATIDVIVRKADGRYYAFLKDERWPSFDWPTGKTIRVVSSANRTGPWSDPSAPLTPNFREAPTLIPRPDGKAWFLYYEQYPGVQYGLSTAPALDGPWHSIYIKSYSVPENARHGCMIRIGGIEYRALEEAYGGEDGTEK